jgi:cytoskeletal protein CcmA (bactofilin family)
MAIRSRYTWVMRILLSIASVLFIVPLNVYAEAASLSTARGNLYVAGGSIDIADHVSNDIVAAGGHITITGSAGGGLLAAGGTIVVSGKIKGDARVAGGNITIAEDIGGELVAGAGRLHLLPDAAIGSELVAGAGEIMLDGTVGGRARIAGGKVNINGTINGDADIRAEEIMIGENAVINGNLRYEAPREAVIDQRAVIKGEKVFKQKEIAPPGWKIAAMAGILWIFKVMAVMAAALAIYLSARVKTLEITSLALDRFGNELVRGFIVLIVVPAFILLLFITMIGWLLGLLSLFFYIAFVTLSGVFGSLVFTRWSSGYVFKKQPSLSWPVILLGVFVHQVIGMVPFVGMIFKFVFFLSALGALSHIMYSAINARIPSEKAGQGA